MIFGLVIIFRN